ncbi:hypothetical protein HBN50_03565 [Halobacteriovorax sp. GB3]|uniref:hypothetical protein n=1 Tax=Halobacteriovorax sp. GB3 TaxID=2719615 RepID=UPI00236039EF|nr:hypothetical protein [Halobacteriovorax sp. GB3]MDD0852156.1 hypothetical protein [Halobacteriovorax sp. GB3]
MKKMFIAMAILSSFQALSLDASSLIGTGSKSVQTLDGEVVATGTQCEVLLEDDNLVMKHDAKIDGWNVGDVEQYFDLSRATDEGDSLEIEVGRVSHGYCGDSRSAKQLVRYMKKEGSKVIFGEEYRCSLFDLTKTVNEHICYLD